jgi:hypothetical protein
MLTAGRKTQARADDAYGVATPPESAAHSAPARLAPEQAREAYGRIEMSFEANRGQTDESVNFLARGAGYTLFLKPSEAVLVLSRRGGAAAQDAPNQLNDEHAIETPRDGEDGTPEDATHEPPRVLRMMLVGANETAAVAGADELEGKVNYFLGSNPSKWQTDVPTYGRVRYAGVYPGVDLVYYGNQRQLEYDFVIAPGRDAAAVKLQFDGADKVETDAEGDLLLTLGDTFVR